MAYKQTVNRITIPQPGHWQLRDESGQIWPPGFEPQCTSREHLRDLAASRHGHEQGARVRSQRAGWAAQGGTVVMAGTPNWLPPGDMRKAK